VAYLLPVFGVALGATFLNEPVDGRLLLGLALIVGGIATVNARFGRRPALSPPTTTQATAAGRRGV
jgi:drug/metabolite transporter (DMT)-like permease